MLMLMLVLCGVGINAFESLPQVYMHRRRCRCAGECILQAGSKLNSIVVRMSQST